MTGERILVIDDKPESVDLLAEYLLRPNGYETIVASNGAQGLQAALDQHPDLIILDQRMPEMNGLQVLRALREQENDVPVILMTAFGDESVIIEALRLGVCDYLAKPYQVDDMLNAVRKGLNSSQSRHQREHVWGELQDIIRQIGHMFVESIDKVFNLVVESAVQMTRSQESYLLLLDETTRELYLRAEKNLDDQVVRHMRMRVDDSFAAHIIQTGQPILFNPLDAEQRFKIKTGYLVRSMINVPLKSSGGVIGVLGVANKQGQDLFTRTDLALLTSLADYAAIGIERAGMFNRTKSELGRRMQELSSIQKLSREFSRTPDIDRIINLVLTQLIQATCATSGMVGIIRDERLLWTARGGWQQIFSDGGWHRWNDGLIDQVLRTQKEACRSMPEESILVMPLIQDERSIGIICLAGPADSPFDASQVEFVRGLADQTVMAMENARLLNAIVEEQRKNSMILSSMADGVYTVSNTLRITSWNEAAERITGWHRFEVIGRLCHEIIPPYPEPTGCRSQASLLQQAMQTDQTVTVNQGDLSIAHRDGHPIMVSCSIAPLKDHADHTVGGVVVFRDVSAERDLQRAKSELIAMISHQLRTPLAHIQLSADLLQTFDLDADMRRVTTSAIQAQANALSTEVERIIVVAELAARRVSISKQPLMLDMIIEQAISSVQATRPERQWIKQIPPSLPMVYADLDKTLTVLHNLLDNAVKFSPPHTPIQIQVTAQPEHAVISIIDQGVGIPPEHQSKLFEPFYRIDNSSTQTVYGIGLGLYIARRYIELQGGRIWVQSQPGQTTCFSLSLPWWSPEQDDCPSPLN